LNLSHPNPKFGFEENRVEAEQEQDLVGHLNFEDQVIEMNAICCYV
jgi:hypothetical protein